MTQCLRKKYDHICCFQVLSVPAPARSTSIWISVLCPLMALCKYRLNFRENHNRQVLFICLQIWTSLLHLYSSSGWPQTLVHLRNVTVPSTDILTKLNNEHSVCLKFYFWSKWLVWLWAQECITIHGKVEEDEIYQLYHKNYS